MNDIKVVSFGYKYGFIEEANVVFDVRCFENPYYVEALRPFSGENEAVYSYVFSDERAEEFYTRMIGAVLLQLDRFIERERDSYTIAFGCTGGRHRSVAFALRTFNYLKKNGYNAVLYHRDSAKAENK